LQKLGIEVVQLFTETEILIKNYLKNNSDLILELKDEEERIEVLFEAIIQKAGQVDVSLQPMIKAELQRSLKSIKNIEGRLLKAEKQKETISVNQIQNLKEKLFPNKSLQERHDNFISLLLFYGEDLIEELLKHLHPLEKLFVVLRDE